MTAQHPAPAASFDFTKPLAFAKNQEQTWQSFLDPISFDEAADKIVKADEADGERSDQGIAAIKSWAFVPTQDGHAALATIPQPGRPSYMLPMRKHSFSQLCARISAPAPYVGKLPAKLQVALMNHGLQGLDDTNGNLLRLSGGEVRALLSDRYAPLDNHLVLDTMRKTLVAAGMLEDVRVRSIACGPTASMRLTIPGHDIVVKGSPKEGDIVEIGIDLLNGEVGNRSISLTPVTWRLVCLNGMRRATREHASRLRHVGDPARLAEAFTDAVPTVIAASQGLADNMSAAVDIMVDDILGEMGLLTQFGLGKGDARDVVREVMADRTIALPEKHSEWADVIHAEGRELSAYDVVNGMTAVAQRRTVDRRIEIEDAAGAYLDRAVRRAA